MSQPGGEQVGTVQVDVVLSTAGSVAKVQAEVTPEMEKLGRTIGERVGKLLAKAIVEHVSTALRDAGRESLPAADRAGRAIGNRMGTAIRRSIEASLRRPFSVKITADAGTVAAVVAQVRSRLAGIRDVQLAIDVDTDAATRQLDTLERRLQGLETMRARIHIDVDTTAALSRIFALEAAISRLSEQTVEITVELNVDSSLGDLGIEIEVETAQALAEIAAVQAAVAGLARSVDIRLDVATGRAVADATELVTTLTAIRGQNYVASIDVDLTAATAETAALRVMLDALDGRNVVVDVVVDTAAAQRDLLGLEAALNHLDIRRVNMDVDVNVVSALRDVFVLDAALRRLDGASIVVTVDVRTAAAMASLNALVTLGAAVDGTSIVIDLELRNLAAVEGALMRMRFLMAFLNAQRITINVDLDAAAAQIALLLLQAQLARTGLAAAGASGGLGAVGVAGIGAAVLLSTTLIPALGAIVTLLFAIAAAAVAAIAAFGIIALAVSGVVTAVQAVNAAQAEAGKSAADLAARQNALKGAADGVRNAERGLATAQRDARKAQEELTEARKAAKEQNEDLSLSIRNNALSQRQAQLDVVSAREEMDAVLADPTATAAEREQAKINYEQAKLQIDDLSIKGKRLAAERKEADKAGIEGSDQVVAARERIAAADERVKAAQQSLAAAERNYAQTAANNANQVSAAVTKMRESMAGLSPEGRAFVAFIVGLKDEFEALRAAAERTFLPGLQRGLEALLPLMQPGGPIIVFIERFGTVLGTLAEKALTALTGPFWTEFFDWLGTEGLTIFSDFAETIGYVIEGFAALVMAFGGTSADIAGGAKEMAAGFADWAKGLGESQGFKDFLAYVQENGPKLLTILGDVVETMGNVIIALAPTGAVMLDALVEFLGFVSELDPAVLLAIAVAVGAIMLAIAVKFAALLSPVTAIVVLVVALVAAVIYAYTHFETFRNIVHAVGDAAVWLWENALKPAWAGIVAATTWLWENVLKPAFNGIAWVITNVLIPTVMWLYENVFKPAWAGIVLAVDVAWAILQVIFGLIQIAIKALGMLFSWLYDNIIKPVWEGISRTISTIWNENVKPILTVLGTFISEHVAPAFSRGVAAIGQAWEMLKEAAAKPIRFVIEEVLNNGILAAYNAVAKYFNVKPDNVSVAMPAALRTTSAITRLTPGGTAGGTGGRAGFAVATGGYIRGPGTGMSDSIPAWLSNGEYVIPAHVVRALGPDFFHGLIGARRVVDTAGSGFFEGGLMNWVNSTFLSGVGGFLADPVGTLQGKADALLDAVPGTGPARDTVVGGGKKIIDNVAAYLRAHLPDLTGGGGWEWQVKVLNDHFGTNFGRREADPGRRGRTLTGKISNHTRGLAVDIPADRKYGQWIYDTYRPKTLELITPYQDINLYYGKQHTYTGAVWNQHNFAGGNAHTHWAYPRQNVFGTAGPGDATPGGDPAVASIAIRTARAMGASARVLLSLMEAGVVESGMRNLNYGDRDSLGFLQQRASWGSEASRMNVAESTTRYIRKAMALEGRYSTAGRLAQGVQVSAFPDRYDAARGAALGWLLRFDPSFPTGTYDSGGLLMPGLTVAYNGTGRPERILTEQQWQALAGAATRPNNSINIYPQRADFTMADLQALQARHEALARIGRQG